MENRKSMEYWEKLLAPYKTPTIFKSLFQLGLTLALLAVACYAMYRTAESHYYITLLMSVLAGSFLTKLFIIQHDCGHGAFFKSKRANDILGLFLTVFTITPYGQWAKAHNRHHATSGRLNRRGVGDIKTWTITEYNNVSKARQFLYRLYRHPVFLFGLGGLLQFSLVQRLPFYKKKQWSSWRSVIFTDIYILIVVALLCYWVGITMFLKIYIPMIFVGCSIGTWLFYIQHQYEDAYWEEDDNWNYCDAALKGSSFYDLPQLLHWMTGSIGYHHIHHLSAKIPNYNLEKCYNSLKELQNINKIGVWESRKCPSLALWDEVNKKLVDFKSLKAI